MENPFEKPSRRRSSTICVFECNACLVGATKTTLVVVRNTGRSAKFICVPEDVWYTKSVEVSKKLSFSSGRRILSSLHKNM